MQKKRKQRDIKKKKKKKKKIKKIHPDKIYCLLYFLKLCWNQFTNATNQIFPHKKKYKASINGNESKNKER
jgi:hypothetical protein